jgi:uncharacterized protein DUF6390
VSEASATATAAAAGPLLFARYAYPPNELGYCGPGDSAALLEYASAGISDDGLRALARGFEGAMPYLRLIAASNDVADPLDRRVVEAYWIGNGLLDRVDPAVFASFVEDTFGARAGRRLPALAEATVRGALPHHNFHVFGVYPWIGLLRAGRIDEPLRVVEGCRIRWGRVEAVAGRIAIVRSRPIVWESGRLRLGREREETVTASAGGMGLAGRIRAGDLVSMHWGWVCDRLDRRRATALQRYTEHALAVVNAGARSSVPTFD